jgi:hypothetical protein
LLNINIQTSTMDRYKWIDSGIKIENNFIILNKSKFISIFPEFGDFNGGNINIEKYDTNLLLNL